MAPRNVARSLGDAVGHVVSKVSSPHVPQLPVVDVGAYVAPYDQQIAATQAAAGASAPAINAAYDQSQANIDALSAQLDQQIAAMQAELQARLAATQGNIAGVGQGVAADMAQFGPNLAPSLAEAVAAATADQSAQAALSASNHQALSGRMNINAAQSLGQRKQTAELGRAAAHGRSASNLQEVLNQLGLGRADAMARGLSDKSDRDRQLFNIEQQRAADRRARRDERIARDEESRKESLDAMEEAMNFIDDAIGQGFTPAEVFQELNKKRRGIESGSLFGVEVDFDDLKSYLIDNYNNGSRVFRVTGPETQPANNGNSQRRGTDHTGAIGNLNDSPIGWLSRLF